MHGSAQNNMLQYSPTSPLLTKKIKITTANTELQKVNYSQLSHKYNSQENAACRNSKVFKKQETSSITRKITKCLKPDKIEGVGYES